MITDCHLHSFANEAAPKTGAYVPPARDVHDYMEEAAPLGVRRAVVVQASVDGTDNSRLVEVLHAKGPVAWHIELNTEPRSFGRIAALVPDLPEGVRLILDHIGHVDPAAPGPILRLMETGRVWAKLSPMLALCRNALSTETFNRCMWDNPARLYGF